MHELIFTPQGDADLREIENNPSQRDILKAVRKCLAFLETNLRHPSLNTHEFRSLKGPNGEKVFEAYAQQKTPAAYRVFWYYGPERGPSPLISNKKSLLNQRPYFFSPDPTPGCSMYSSPNPQHWLSIQDRGRRKKDENINQRNVLA